MGIDHPCAGAGCGMRLLLPQNFLGSMSGRQPGFGKFGETSRAAAGEGGGERRQEFFPQFPLYKRKTQAQDSSMESLELIPHPHPSQLVNYGLMDYQGRKIPTLSRVLRVYFHPYSFPVKPAQNPGQSSQTSTTTGSFSHQIRKVGMNYFIGPKLALIRIYSHSRSCGITGNTKRSKPDFTSLC